MRRRLLFLVIAIALLSAALPVLAVRFGTPDNGAHPYVGLIVFYDDAMNPLWRCTGTMVSPRVMLTAGHCSESQSGRRAQVWFTETVPLGDRDAKTGYPYTGGWLGVGYSYPLWNGGLTLPNSGDAGVVILDQAPGYGQAALAPAGTLDSLAVRRGRQNTSFEVVGYGLQAVKPQLSAFRTRLRANVQLVNLNSALNDGYNLQTTNAPGNGTGGGGTCFGDSGGAIFYNGQIVAVNSFVLNENCAGASFGYRIDRTDVLNWVWGYINNPPPPPQPAGSDND